MSSAGGSIYIPEDEVYPGNEGRIFNGRLSYNKGAAIIHMLRHEIQDDELFFNVMGTFQTNFTNSTATGEDFKNTAEEVTGMEFDQFFDQWYYGEGYPKYEMEYYNLDGTVHISSLQTTSSSTPFFEMLMDFTLLFTDGTDTTVSFHQTNNLNNFSINTGKTVGYILVDPNDWNIEDILSISVVVEENETPVSFKIGQNQVTGDITLFFLQKQHNDKSIVVSNISGQTIFEGQTSGSQFEINTASFSKGVYFISVTDGKYSFVSKFVK